MGGWPRRPSSSVFSVVGFVSVLWRAVLAHAPAHAQNLSLNVDEARTIAAMIEHEIRHCNGGQLLPPQPADSFPPAPELPPLQQPGQQGLGQGLAAGSQHQLQLGVSELPREADDAMVVLR